MSVPFIKSGEVLTLILKGGSYQILPDHISRKLIMEALPTATEDDLLKLVNVERAISTYTTGLVEVVNDQVLYEGEVVHGTISTRIVEFMKNGLPFDPLVKFLQNLMKNPSMQSQQECYDFLEHKNLAITEDGCFLAYKAVRKDFKDKYSGNFDNSVGTVVEMPRAKVNDNREVGCSKGLHVGALDYVVGYGRIEQEDRIVIVKVNPQDVVSVPLDCSHQKMRVCKYEVVSEYQGELLKPLYSADFSYEDDEDEEYNDYEDYEDYEDDEEYWKQFN